MITNQVRPRTTGNRQSAYRINKAHSPSFPRNIVRDKEYLYDENLNLKLALNTVKDELQLVRIRNMQMEKEVIKYEKMFEERPRALDTSMDKSSLVMKLKHRQKEQQGELLERVRELDVLKKSIRNTRVQEMQAELDSYKTECVRLRQHLNHSLRTLELLKKSDREGSKTIEEQYIIQEGTIKQLMKDNMELSQQNKDLETSSRQFKLIIENLENEVHIKDRELARVNKHYYDAQKEYQDKLRNKMPVKRTHVYEEQQKAAEMQKMHAREIMQLERQFNAGLDDKDQQIDMLQRQLRAKTVQIEQLEKQFYDLTHQDRQEATVAQQRQLIEQVEVAARKSQAILITSQDESIRDNPPSNDASKLSRKSIIKNNFAFIERVDSLDRSIESIALPAKRLSSPQVQRRKKLPKVNLHDVQHLGYKLRIELQLQRIPYASIDQNFSGDGMITIHEAKSVLMCDPFNIESEEDRTLIARYLVEDNQEDFIAYDEQLSNEVEIVRCVIKKLIGRYDLFEPTEEEQIRSQLQQMFAKYSSSILDAIGQFVIKKKYLPQGICEFGDLESAFKFCDVMVSPRQLEYLRMVIFKLSGDLDRVFYVKLRDEFKS